MTTDLVRGLSIPFAEAQRALEHYGVAFARMVDPQVSRVVSKIDWRRWKPTDVATLVFVVEPERLLLIRKKRGLGAGKINGPGGRREPGETLDECAARELEEVPAKIECLESEHREFVELLSQPAFYQSGAAEQARVHSRVAALASELEAVYARWDELETLRDGG